MKKVLMTSASRPFLSRNSSFLANKGFQFFTSSSGLEALKLHEEHNFDLILSDLELEDMDGCKLCSEVRKFENPQSIPVVLICQDTVECLERVKQSDASALLFRPINPTHLLITIGSFIEMQLARSNRVVFTAKVLTQKQGLEFFGVSHDISATGLLIETEQLLELGDRIICQFTLPDISEIQAEGEVTRCLTAPDSKILYGIKFIELPLYNRSKIERYVVSNTHLGIKEKPYHPLERGMR